eukprot:gene6153-10160_t
MKTPCKHFTNFTQKHKNLSNKINEKLKENKITCKVCHKSSGRIAFCLHCDEFFCIGERGHLIDHFSKSPKHHMAFDTQFKQLYCNTCSDFIIFENSSTKNLHVPNQISYVGLRGLYNLGNTCFMNTVIQTFVHNPIFKDYLLNCDLKDNEELNIGVELKYIMKQMHNGSKKPFNPHRFLYSIWNHGGFFFGYSQQDAHEFYMTILNFDEIQNFSKVVFQGQMQSDIVCTKCKSVSTTYDPFIDISLNMKSLSKEESNLEDCLQKYTKSESIGETVYCKSCEGKYGSTKQLSIKSIPVILCFHMKRFRQRKDKTSVKNDNHINFPFEVDLYSYTSDSKKSNKKEKCYYSLFSVIEHRGNLDSGHYVCFIKQDQKWYLCDDEYIYESSIESVMKSEAYLLFYIRKEL